MTLELFVDIERLKIQSAIKTLMKQKHMTYESMSTALDTSPATIKRRLNGPDISLQQLMELAQVLKITFYELIEMSKSEGSKPYQFSEAQERVLSENILHLMVIRFAMMGRSFEEILSLLSINALSLRKIIRKLENENLLKLMPHDEIICNVRFPVKWIPDGKLDTAYKKHTSKVIVDQMMNDKGSAGLNQQFEFALSSDLYAGLCQDLEEVFTKYRNFSQALLTSSVSADQIVSGVLFADQFSCWGDATQFN